MTPRFKRAGDRSWLLEFGTEISEPVRLDVLNAVNRLRPLCGSWLTHLQPAYASVLVSFDPCTHDSKSVEAKLNEVLAAPSDKRLIPEPERRIEIPVCYDGPDLQDVALQTSLTISEVIRLHEEGIYRVYFLGFVPGFAYLGGLSPKLKIPRLRAPRLKVEPGSVAIADLQTAVYPFETPGGWSIIGRTPLKIFDVHRDPMSRFQMGDLVRFRSISRGAFDSWVSQ